MGGSPGDIFIGGEESDLVDSVASKVNDVDSNISAGSNIAFTGEGTSASSTLDTAAKKAVVAGASLAAAAAAAAAEAKKAAMEAAMGGEQFGDIFLGGEGSELFDSNEAESAAAAAAVALKIDASVPNAADPIASEAFLTPADGSDGVSLDGAD